MPDLKDLDIFFITDEDPFPPTDGRKVPVANYFWQLEELGFTPKVIVPQKRGQSRGLLGRVNEIWNRVKPYGPLFTREFLSDEQKRDISSKESPIVFVAPARLMSLAIEIKRINASTRIVLILNDAQWTMNLEALLFGVGWYPGGARHDLLKGILLPTAMVRELTAYTGADCVMLQTEREAQRLPWLSGVSLVTPNSVAKPKVKWRGEDSTVFAVQVNFSNRRAGKLRPFITETWPKIRAAEPTYELELFGPGARTPDWATDVDGVRYVGLVDDLDVYLATKRGFLVPLEHATGISNTVLRGLAIDIPLIITHSSSLGVRNLLAAESKVNVARSQSDFVQMTLASRWDSESSEPRQIGSWRANMEMVLTKLKIDVTSSTPSSTQEKT